jgi:hypothetical protein
MLPQRGRSTRKLYMMTDVMTCRLVATSTWDAAPPMVDAFATELIGKFKRVHWDVSYKVK